MRFFDTFTDFEEGDRYNVSPLHMQEQLSHGYFLVNEFSHGWIDAWGGLEHQIRQMLNLHTRMTWPRL